MLGKRVNCAQRTRESSGYIRCNWAALSCFFSLSTSFFKNLMWRIMFSGESISMEMSLGDGGAETGWSNFSCRILPWKEKFQQWKRVCLKRQNNLLAGVCFQSKLLQITGITGLSNSGSAHFISTSGLPYLVSRSRSKGRAEGPTLFFFFHMTAGD